MPGKSSLNTRGFICERTGRTPISSRSNLRFQFPNGNKKSVRITVSKEMPTPILRIGLSIWARLIPPALNATISLSEESRLNPISVPTRNAIGTVNTKILGRRQRRTFKIVVLSAFFLIKSSVKRPNSRLKTMKVRTTKANKIGGITSW